MIKRKYLLSAITFCALAANAGEQVRITDAAIHYEPGTLRLDAAYQLAPDCRLEAVSFRLKNATRELQLTSPVLTELAGQMNAGRNGDWQLEIPLPYLPAGEYELVAAYRLHAEADNRVLKSSGGRCLIGLPAYGGADYDYRVRILEGAFPLFYGQPGIKQSSDTWDFYDLEIHGNNATGMWYGPREGVTKWDRLTPYDTPCPPPDVHGWRDVTIRCRAGAISFEVDGQSFSGTPALLNSGFPGFRSDDQGVAYIDRVELRDPTTGELRFVDDFERDQLGDDWQILGGDWQIARGIPVTETDSLGKLTVEAGTAKELPRVALERRGDGIDFSLNGELAVPLFFSLGATSDASYRETTYQVLRNVHEAGIRFLVPLINIAEFDADGHMKLERLDDIMAQSLAAAPEAYFILRMGVPSPPDLTDDERFQMAKKAGDAPRPNGFPDTKVEANYQASLAAERYPEYVAGEIERIIAHCQAQGYADRILGMLVTGGGYEINWVQPGAFPEYLTDCSPAQVKHFGEFLRARYGTEAALQTAWGDPEANFTTPKIPFINDRTVSDVAGFRDPSQPKSRWVIDFLDCYTAEGDEALATIFERIGAKFPESFFGVFNLLNLNSAWAGAGPACYQGSYPVFEMPGLAFVAGILSYHDRMAGGVSACTVSFWESLRLHGKMALQEVDMRTPVTNELITEKSYADAAASMRREFANVCLVEHNAMWNFDMGYTGSWYNHPELMQEMAAEMRVGRAALGLKRRNQAESVVVSDMDSWRRQWGITPQPLTGEENVPFSSLVYVMNFDTLAMESISRSGLVKDTIALEDLAAKPDYKFYIFPSSFGCDPALRRRIQALAESGAVCLLMGAAGISDGERTHPELMSELLGMTIRVDGPMPLTATMEADPAAGFDGTEVAGGNGYVLPQKVPYIPEWYRFSVDAATPGIKVLARYPDGEIAMAARQVGSGWLVYSGVPVTHPKVYRALGRLAGAHVYSEGDDALYADGNFVVLHSRETGTKTITLPAKAPQVLEVFERRIIGRDTDRFSVEMEPGRTAVFFIGEDPDFPARLEAKENEAK